MWPNLPVCCMITICGLLLGIKSRKIPAVEHHFSTLFVLPSCLFDLEAEMVVSNILKILQPFLSTTEAKMRL